MDFKKDIYQDPDIKKYVKVISRDPRAFASLANALLNKGYVEEAIDICQEGLEADPDFIAGRAVLGKCYVKDGRIDEAREEFETILEQNHDNVVALIGLGEIYYSREEYDAAKKMYDQLLFIDPMNEEFQEMVEKIKDLQSGRVPRPPRQEIPASESPVQKEEGSGDADSADVDSDISLQPEAEPSSDAVSPPAPEGVYVAKESAYQLLQLLEETAAQARDALSRGFDESNQPIFNMLASGVDTSLMEEARRRFSAYLKQEAGEGDIVPIERGVSPHKSDDIEIDGTENIGIASNQEVKIDQNVVSYDNIVSNDQIAYQESVQEEEEGERPDSGESEAPQTTLKGPDDIDMEMRQEPENGDAADELIPENDLNEMIEEEMASEEMPIPVEEPETLEEAPAASVPPPSSFGGDHSPEDEVVDTPLSSDEEMLEDEEILDETLDDLQEEALEEIPGEGFAEEENEDMSQLKEEEGFREDSYPSLEEDLNNPQDLNSLMAEAEKSLSGDALEVDEDLDDDIMNELEEESRALQEEKSNEAFSGESLVRLDEETQVREDEKDRFAGHREIDVNAGEPAAEEINPDRFKGREELDMSGAAVPPPVSSEEEIRPDSIAPSDLDLGEEPLPGSNASQEEISIDEDLKGNDNADELVDADEETLDDIGKWLSDL